MLVVAKVTQASCVASLAAPLMTSDNTISGSLLFRLLGILMAEKPRKDGRFLVRVRATEGACRVRVQPDNTVGLLFHNQTRYVRHASLFLSLSPWRVASSFVWQSVPTSRLSRLPIFVCSICVFFLLSLSLPSSVTRPRRPLCFPFFVHRLV